MNKTRISIFFLVVLFMTTTSCRKVLEPVNSEGEITFFLRLPSLTLGRFEAQCVTEDIFLDQVRVQSPSGSYIIDEFDHQRIVKNEIITVGNQEAEDGLWLITFMGTSAITNKDFQKTIPYEMVIGSTEDL